jgi:dTDP-4-dehydrorhamnose 3,5-epimerase
MVFLPGWCAHGFCVLSDVAELIYKVTAEYAPELEGGLLWNDPDLGIDWPIRDPILSERDKKWPVLRELESSFVCRPTQE